MSLIKRSLAEFIGTFWLVLGGCGSAVLAAAYTTESAKISVNTSFPLGIGLVGVSLAFGLTVLTGAYALGHISGGHFNPARSTGVAIFAGTQLFSQVWLFWVAPILGAIVAGWFYLTVFSETSVEAQQNIEELV